MAEKPVSSWLIKALRHISLKKWNKHPWAGRRGNNGKKIKEK
jgi:hypothetical protein